MKACRKFRGLIAASIYEEPSESERDVLDRHLASCAACRAEAEGLRKLTSAIPNITPELDRDLLSAVRHRLAEQAAPVRRLAWRLALVGATCVLLIGAIAYTVLGPSFVDQRSSVASLSKSEPAVAASPLQSSLDEAMQFIETRKFTQAARILAEALETYPDDPHAGQAQKLLADVAFENLQWYPVAHTAYRTLTEKYPDVFMASQESIFRRDLLAETCDKDFEALYEIDAAKQSVGDAFAKLERVVCEHPGKLVASRAAKEMSRLMLEEGPPPAGENRNLYAMAQARERCTEPVAIVQLTLEMGLICWEELSDSSRARDLFNEAVDNEHTVLAQRELARDSLLSLPKP